MLTVLTVGVVKGVVVTVLAVDSDNVVSSGEVWNFVVKVLSMVVASDTHYTRTFLVPEC